MAQVSLKGSHIRFGDASGKLHENAKNATANGLNIAFNPRAPGGKRQVSIKDHGEEAVLSFQLGKDEGTESVRGILDASGKSHDIETRGEELYIDGRRFDFAKGELEPEKVRAKDQRSPEQKLAELKARFPHVKFTGDPSGVRIEDSVQFAKPAKGEKYGAEVHLSPGLEIRGDSIIGNQAKIHGGVIDSCDFNGTLHDGRVLYSNVAAGAVIASSGKGPTARHSTIENCDLDAGARVRGSQLTDVRVGEGTNIADATARDSDFAPKTTIYRGSFKNIDSNEGDKFFEGTHDGLREVGPQTFRARATRLRESPIKNPKLLSHCLDTAINDLELLRVECDVDSRLDKKAIDKGVAGLTEQWTKLENALSAHDAKSPQVKAAAAEANAEAAKIFAAMGKLKRSDATQAAEPVKKARGKIRQWIEGLLGGKKDYAPQGKLNGNHQYQNPMMNLEYEQMQRARANGQTLHPQGRDYGGTWMPDGIFGNSEQGQKRSGLGKKALIAAGAVGLLSMGMGCFGMGGMGLGFGSMMLPMLLMGGGLMSGGLGGFYHMSALSPW